MQTLPESQALQQQQQQQHQQSSSLLFTSTTAPGTAFSSREELAQHYKSDWHKYNLKRRETNLPMLTYIDFQARLDAALTIRREKESRDKKVGTNHLKKYHQQEQQEKEYPLQEEEDQGVIVVEKKKKKEEEDNIMMEVQQLDNHEKEKDTSEEDNNNNNSKEKIMMIDPTMSLFDKHTSYTVQENLQYMYQKYGFFVPDKEYLMDIDGFIGYCHEKIQVGHVCLYCQKIFQSHTSCIQHMIQTRHTMIQYQAGIDLDEFEVFYDFSKDNEEFLNKLKKNKKKKNTSDYDDTQEDEEKDSKMDIDIDDNDDDEWEDIEEEEEEEDDDKRSQDYNDYEEEMYDAYEDEIAKFGFEVTSLGELIFPNGKVIGHRALSKYYKQRFTPMNTNPAVLAAKMANSERLYKGRVYQLSNITQRSSSSSGSGARASGIFDYSSSSTLALSKAGFNAHSTMGRAGAGILVQTSTSANSSSSAIVGGRFNFTALSLYRFQAVMKKARKDEFRARRMEQRTRLPINKMDKKANRMFNNISIAHCRD